jgi:DNA-directed RNA polymerase specialized sigma24 family protein
VSSTRSTGSSTRRCADRKADPEARDELIDALDTLAALKDRQRVTLGLFALGLRRTEIAEVTGDTLLMVSRLMRRARKAVFDQLEQADGS